MKSRVVPSEDNEEFQNHSMELQAISTGDDPYSGENKVLDNF